MIKKALAVAVFLLAASLFVSSASTSSWAYSPVYFPGWYQDDFDVTKWILVPQPYESQSTQSDLYFKGFVDADPGQSSVNLTIYADDCLLELYFDGISVFNATECGACTHCSGIMFRLPIRADKPYHTLAAHVKNNGGSGMFKVEQDQPWLSFNIRPSTSLFLVAMAFLSAALFLPARVRRWHLKALLILFAYGFVTLSFLTPLVENAGNWGIHDWDYFFFNNAVARKTILTYHQLPMWNPYACGGTVILANPQSFYLTPTFNLILLFGVEYGIKLQMLLHYLIGLIGMYLLARLLKMGEAGSHMAAFVYMLSAVIPLHFAEGHYTWIAAAWVPYVAYFYLRATQEDMKWAVPAALSLALIYLEGHAYLFVYVILFLLSYAPLTSFFKRTFTPVKVTAVILVLCLLFGAIKIVPQVLYTKDNPRTINDSSGLTWDILAGSLIDRYQALGAHSFKGQVWGWHEYGGYIGEIPLILALAAIILGRANKPLVLTLLFILILAFNESSPLGLWGILHDYAPFMGNLRTPERLILMVNFILAMCAAMGLNAIERHDKRMAVVILFFVLFDLWNVNGSILSMSFPITARTINADSTFRQTLAEGVGDRRYSGMYEVFLANHGALDCYDPGGLTAYATPWKVSGVLKESYRGEAYLVNGGNANIIEFTPNRVTASVGTLEPTLLVLNQNYHDGWSSDAGVVKPYLGLVSVAVSPLTSKVTFTYTTPGLAAGALITVLALAGSAAYLTAPNAKKRVKR
ncbi:Uncharacterised protein [uncultured archaeon]|nr:Uncharacterised protein [uncultured archaeon]